MFKRFDYLETIDSTNEYLKRFVEDRIARIVVAAEQTAGKGRFGRSWHSPRGDGLYVSYLLYPEWNEARAPFLTMMAALAVVRSIHRFAGSSTMLKLKPPNDVLIDGKKVCGILTELSTLTGRIGWAIIGVGVNVYQKEFSGELKSKATSLAREGIFISNSLDLCDRLTQEIEEIYGKLVKGRWEEIRGEFEELQQ